jgi:hypothetical protein
MTTPTPIALTRALCGSGLGGRFPASPQIAPEDDVLRQSERHADGGRTETVVEPEPGLEQAGDQWTDEGTQVDPEVEQREPAVGAWISLLVKRAEQRRGVRFQSAAAQRDQHQADADSCEPWQQRKRDVPEHHDDAAVEHHPFHADEAVGQPAAEHSGQVHQAAVRTDDAGRGLLGQPEPALLERVVEVVPENGEHPVEGETLPELDPEQVRETDRVAEYGSTTGGELFAGSCRAARHRSSEGRPSPPRNS